MTADREVYWRRKLGRLRFGAEPIEEQLARQLRVTFAISAVVIAIGSMMLALFASFGRIAVGAAVIGVLLGPVVGSAWLDYAFLRARASRYLAELAASRMTETPPG